MASKTSMLYFHIVKRNNDEFELAVISENKETWYVLPEEKKDLSGSLIDYALAKENLSLEIEMLRINMIVMGFPVEIQNREEITTNEKLFKELTKSDECVFNIKPKYDNKFLSNKIPYNTDVKAKQLYQHKQRYENVDKDISVPKYKVEAKTNNTLNKQNQRYENNTLNKKNFVRPNFIRKPGKIECTDKSKSLINRKIIDILKLGLMNNRSTFKTISGFNFSSARANIVVKVGNLTDNLNTYVVKNNNFSYDLLLGLDAIKKFKLIQDENFNILQRINKNKIIKIEERDKMNNNHNMVKSDELTDNQFNLQKAEKNNLIKISEVNFNENMNNTICKNLDYIKDENRRKDILNLINKYKHMFAKDKYDVGKVKSKEAKIKLTRDEYVTARPYKCSIVDEEKIKTQVEIGRTFDPSSQDFILDKIMEWEFSLYLEQINDISQSATKEIAIEQGLAEITETWEGIEFDLVPFKDKDQYKIRSCL
ncbi:hypothetical protein HELRODRAFT_162913 [Helobdella robusta]|uniref:Dynein heavy chain linker domain-containing protein n=1 Tax=Helobdella robusta TaxID=6412 RepID=T1ETC4_HELRO|nr:hypothetical protein HELRODRAFT_162913 [Helobdella robusta]ESN99371.1 hypothetical protein HELRODRAFT_162913 [Helobdella robusta]